MCCTATSFRSVYLNTRARRSGPAISTGTSEIPRLAALSAGRANDFGPDEPRPHDQDVPRWTARPVDRHGRDHELDPACALRSTLTLPDLIKRDETKRTGIYFLSGIDPETGSKTQVISEKSDNVARRFAQHNKAELAGGRDFSGKVCLVSSKDRNLTKTHVRFLEGRLISICSGTGRASLMNRNGSRTGYLPEPIVLTWNSS